MALTAQLQDDLHAAMRANDPNRRDAIRWLLTIIHRAEVERQAALGESEIVEIIRKEARGRRDAIEEFRKAGRQDLVDKEQAQLTVVEGYLPPAMSKEEIGAIVRRIIGEVGASGPADIGKVMPKAMAELRGRADGREVNQVVREQLAEQR